MGGDLLEVPHKKDISILGSILGSSTQTPNPAQHVNSQNEKPKRRLESDASGDRGEGFGIFRPAICMLATFAEHCFPVVAAMG